MLPIKYTAAPTPGQEKSAVRPIGGRVVVGTLVGHGGRVAESERSDPTDWLLRKDERGHPSTRLDDVHPGQQAWSKGNLVRPLVHGATCTNASRRPVPVT